MSTGKHPSQRETRTQAVLAQLRTYGLPPDTTIFTHYATYGAYVWHVTQALAVIQARPRPAHIVHPPLMEQTLRTAVVDRAAVAKADPTRPGITAMFYDVAARYWTEVVIDGCHRCTRAHQTGSVFTCYALTPIEAFVLLLAHPYV